METSIKVIESQGIKYNYRKSPRQETNTGLGNQLKKSAISQKKPSLQVPQEIEINLKTQQKEATKPKQDTSLNYKTLNAKKKLDTISNTVVDEYWWDYQLDY